MICYHLCVVAEGKKRLIHLRLWLFLIFQMPEFGFPQFTVVGSLSYFSRKEASHPQSPAAVPQPSSAATKGILMMSLHCQRLPSISKSSFAIKCFNSLLEWVILTLSECLLCPNTKPVYPSSCTAKFSEAFWDRCKTKEGSRVCLCRAASNKVDMEFIPRGNDLGHSWRPPLLCPAARGASFTRCQGLDTAPKTIQFTENLWGINPRVCEREACELEQILSSLILMIRNAKMWEWFASACSFLLNNHIAHY